MSNLYVWKIIKDNTKKGTSSKKEDTNKVDTSTSSHSSQKSSSDPETAIKNYKFERSVATMITRKYPQWAEGFMKIYRDGYAPLEFREEYVAKHNDLVDIHTKYLEGIKAIEAKLGTRFVFTNGKTFDQKISADNLNTHHIKAYTQKPKKVIDVALNGIIVRFEPEPSESYSRANPPIVTYLELVDAKTIKDMEMRYDCNKTKMYYLKSDIATTENQIATLEKQLKFTLFSRKEKEETLKHLKSNLHECKRQLHELEKQNEYYQKVIDTAHSLSNEQVESLREIHNMNFHLDENYDQLKAQKESIPNLHNENGEGKAIWIESIVEKMIEDNIIDEETAKEVNDTILKMMCEYLSSGSCDFGQYSVKANEVAPIYISYIFQERYSKLPKQTNSNNKR